MTCGSGTRTRVRQCKQSDKNCDKATCSGSSDQRQQCFMRSCEPIEDPPGRTTTTATGLSFN